MSERVKRLLFQSAIATRWLRASRVVLHRLARAPHEADFRALAHPALAGGLLLDLGANIGQSALSACKVQPSLRVLSIEANPACEAGLRMARRLLGGRMDYRLVGVGAQAGCLRFHVPVRNSRMLLEEGTFDAASLQSPASVARLGREGTDYILQTIDVTLLPVDALNLSPRIVKMDLQGLELAALQGMTATLARCWPLLMVEVGEQHASVVAFLAERGYGRYHWDGRHLAPGGHPNALNEFFVHPGDGVLKD